MADEEATKKSRARQACETCRKKKTKCSGETPICSNCAAHGFECNYVGVEKRRGPQKGYVRALESRLDSLQNLLEDYVEKISPAGHSGSRSNSIVDGGEVFFDDEDALETRSSQGSSPKAEADQRSVALASRNLTKVTNSKKRPHNPLAPPKTGSLTIIDNGVYRYCGESSGAYLLQQRAEGAQIFHLPPDNNKRNATLLSMNLDFALTKPQLDAFVSLFFTTSHCHTPVLVKDDFLNEYKSPNSSIPQSLLDAICACSSAHVSNSPMSGILTDPIKIGESCFVRSRQHILSLVDQASIPNIQALLLLSTCHHLNLGSMSWINLGIAIRMAVEIGLHRDFNPPNPTLEQLKEREVRRRVWWCCYIFDRISSVTAGRPLAIDEDEYDTQFPDFDWESSENLNLVNDTVPMKVISLDCRKKYFYKYTELCQIFGKVTRNIYSVKSRQGYSALKLQSHIQHIYDNLQNWYSNLKRDWPQLLDSEVRKNSEFNLFGLSLEIYYHALVILLHRPLLPRPDSQISSFTKPYYNKCKESATIIVHKIKEDIDSFLDFSSSFKVYPLVAAFSIHLLGASTSVENNSLQEESKKFVFDCLCVLSRFSALPLFKKILFGCFNTLTSLNIVPLGFVDESWPNVLKLASKSYAVYVSNLENNQNPTETQPDKDANTGSNGSTTNSSAPLNPTEFLKSKVSNGNHHATKASNHYHASESPASDVTQDHPNKKFKEQESIQDDASKFNNHVSPQATSFPPQNPYVPNHSQPIAHSNATFDQGKSNTFDPSFQGQHSVFTNNMQNFVPNSMPVASNQMMYNNFTQSNSNPNSAYQQPMLQFMNNSQPPVLSPSQMVPFPFNNPSYFNTQQTFPQGNESFVWDPLYNFNFTGFNPNGL